MCRVPTPLTVRDVEDSSFQHTEWTVQRFWWPLLTTLIVAALLGLFSGGPLSETTAGGPSAAVEVTYERFLRNTGRATWTIRVAPQAVEDHKATVFISDDLSRAMQVNSITPTPSSETSTRAGLLLGFDVPRPESPPVVRLHFRPDAIGVRDGVIRGGDGDGVALWLLFYP